MKFSGSFYLSKTLETWSVWGILGTISPRVLPNTNWVVSQIDGYPATPKQRHAKGCVSLDGGWQGGGYPSIPMNETYSYLDLCLRWRFAFLPLDPLPIHHHSGKFVTFYQPSKQANPRYVVRNRWIWDLPILRHYLGPAGLPGAGLKSPKHHGFMSPWGPGLGFPPQRIGGGLMLFCAALVIGVYFYGQSSKNKERFYNRGW